MIVLDIEASGVNPEKHSIVSIGALHLENPTNQFYDECRVWDGAHIDPKALEINGFTKEELLDPNKKSEAEIVKAFIAWATDIEGDRTLAGQNVSFDRDFVRLGAERAGIDYPFAFRTIDSHSLGQMHMIKAGITPPVANHRSALDLDAILNYCGIPDEPMPHNALTGAMSHAEVISRLLFDKKLLPVFDEFSIPWKTEGG
jgi:DNA polymerase III epsilon subunit-like protein